MGRSEPDAGSLHPTQQFSQKRFVPSRRRYWGSSTDILTKRMKKMTAITVVDVTRRGHRLRRPQAVYAPCHAHA